MGNKEIYIKVYTALGGLQTLSGGASEGVKVLTNLDKKNENYNIEMLVPLTSIDDKDYEDNFLRLK